MNDWMTLGFNWVVRSVLLLALICTFVLLFQRRRPLAASSLLSVGVWGLLLLPLAIALLPSISLPLLGEMHTSQPDISIGLNARERTSDSIAPLTDISEKSHEAFVGESASVSSGGESGNGPTTSSIVEDAQSVVESDTSRPAATLPAVVSRDRSNFAWPWLAIAAAIYLTGVAILTIRFINNLSLIRRLRNSGSLCPQEWAERLDHWKRQIGETRRVEVLVTDEVSVPLTVGLIKPVILLPASLGSASATHQDAVLVHELAHIYRRDFLDVLVLQVAKIIYWWNPLIWIADAFGRSLRECACDDGCIY